MNKTVFTSFAAISILGLASTSIAAGDEKITFESLDKNNDGYVERTDIPADHDLANLFASYDMNQDNRLSAVEFNRYLGQDEAEEGKVGSTFCTPPPLGLPPIAWIGGCFSVSRYRAGRSRRI